MAVYEPNIQQVDALGSFMRGAQSGQQMADNRRQNQARNALARLQQGDTSAMAELQQADPDAAQKYGEFMRTESDRKQMASFFKPAQANLVMPSGSPVDNALSVLAGGNMTPQIVNSRPASLDAMGLTQFKASRGDKDALESLVKIQNPDATKYGMNPQTGINPATGKPEFFVSNERGIPKFLGIGDRPKIDVKGGFIVDPETGQLGAPIPMTPAQIAADRRASEAADRANRQLEVSVAGLQQNQAKSQQEMQDKTEKKQQERDGKFKSVNDLDSTLAAYRQSLSGASRADLMNPVGDKSVELQNLATQLQMAYKNAAELGAITGPDWAIINRIVATPSGAKAALLGPEKLIKQLDQVEALSKRQRAELNRVYGDQSKPAAQAKTQQAGGRKDTTTAVNWLKSKNITSQGQFDSAVASMKKQGWSAEEINQALDRAGL